MRISDWSSDVCSSDLCATWHTSTSGKTSLTMRHQLTGNVGLYHVARELSRRGWHVMPTVRNARGADLYAASDDEARVLPIQSKALSKRSEEHTSELQSLMRISYAVFCLKKTIHQH